MRALRAKRTSSRVRCAFTLVELLVVIAIIGVLGVGFYVAMLRMLPKRPALREQALEPTDPDLAVEL